MGCFHRKAFMPIYITANLLLDIKGVAIQFISWNWASVINIIVTFNDNTIINTITYLFVLSFTSYQITYSNGKKSTL
jgi:hypothetical protein